MIISLCAAVPLRAQDTLDFNAALELTLKNNFDIRIAKGNLERSEINATKVANGYLPDLSTQGSYNWTYYQGKNELITGDQIFDANSSYNYNASATLSYALYDGNLRKYNLLQSIEQAGLDESRIRQTIEATIVELTAAYNNLAQSREQYALIDETLKISAERRKRVEYGIEYGQSTQLDMLNAQVDYNTDSIALVQAAQALETARRTLNLVMGAEIELEVEPELNVAIRRDILLEEALNSAMSGNVRIELVQHNLLVAEYSIESTRSRLMPQLSANTGFLYRGSDDPNGAFVKGSEQFGPNAGLTFSWTIWNAADKTRVESSKIDLQNARLEREKLLQEIETELRNAHSDYLTKLRILELQRLNQTTARRNFQRSEEAWQRGQITSIEFRNAQLNLQNARQSLSNAKFSAKNAEVTLLALMGALVDNE